MQHDNELVREAYINLKVGDRSLARRYAERALLGVDDIDTKVKAIFILSQTTDDPREKRDLLETVLANDPAHAEARRALAILDGKLKPEDIVDADNLPDQEEGEQHVRAERFTCPRCGARRVFAPDGISLHCEHCGTDDLLAGEHDGNETDFFIAMATTKGHRKAAATLVFHCNGCGAEFVLAPGVISASCAYCDSPHVIRLDQFKELLEPDGILPHSLTQKQAVQKLVDWVDLHRIKPEQKVDMPRGIYLPLWTFDLGGGFDYIGKMLQSETEDSNQVQRMVRVQNKVPVLVDDVLVPACKKNADLITSLLPTIEMSALRSYDPRYLANWPAAIYDIPMSDASLTARGQVARQYREQLSFQLSYLDDLRLSSAGMTVESFKLILFPVWITEIHFRGKTHTILINGQNGRVVGGTPL